MKQFIKKGTTSKRVLVFIQDSSVTTGAGKTGLAYNTASLVCYRAREDDGNAGGTALALVTATKGTWASGGFVEKDATNMPGVYELGLDDAGLAAGSSVVVYMLKGAANMVPCLIECQLADQAGFGKNQAFSNFEFTMVQSGDHVTAGTGLTVTAQRSIDGGAFAACANAVSEVANGTYKINLAAADLNGTVITLLFTATGADPRRITIVTTPTT